MIVQVKNETSHPISMRILYGPEMYCTSFPKKEEMVLHECSLALDNSNFLCYIFPYLFYICEKELLQSLFYHSDRPIPFHHCYMVNCYCKILKFVPRKNLFILQIKHNTKDQRR